MPSRPVWIAIFLLTFTLGTSARAAQPTDKNPQKQPNILVILADDMGYGDLGCYGSLQIRTPHLDRLAAHGIRCTNGYVSGNVCAPSRAGFLTGRYQQRFGFEHNLGGAGKRDYHPHRLGIPAEQPTMADRLKKLGYRTGLIGKWHVGEATPEMLPGRKGFDYFFGMHNGSHGYFPTADNHHLWRNDAKVESIDVPYLTNWFTEEAISFMRPDSVQPWFLYLSYNTPHTPLEAKEVDLKAYSEIPHPKRRTYAAMQTCMDTDIGRMIQHLEDTNQLNNTLIVFFSDNGGSVTASHACNAPLNGMKGSFLEGGIRVPFIFHWPAGLPAGQTYDQPLISLDLLPTFLAAAGGEMPEEYRGQGRNRQPVVYDGVDLLPFLKGEKPNQPPHATLFWRMVLRGAAVRSGDWKLITCVHTPPMLFNLADDPSEQHNLYLAQPAKALELWNQLNQWEYSLEDTPHWFEGVRWQQYNQNLYLQSYNLTQPAPDQWPTPWAK